MELHHQFTVPAGVEEAWAHFDDIESVAGCFPGATVTEADAESFKGTVKVKLGPIALVYNGTGRFVEKDEAAHRLVIDAKGKDKRGNGTAGAMVTATMTESAPGSTDVEVATDLSITGKAAQFGRGGVIQDVSDKLLRQFAACLEEQLSSSSGAPADEESVAPEEPKGEASGGDPTSGDAGPTAEPDPPSVAPPPAASGDTGAATAVPDPEAPQPAATPPPAPRRSPPPSSGQDDAIDLGSTVLPVLFRAYWKQALAGLVVVLVIIWLLVRD